MWAGDGGEAVSSGGVAELMGCRRRRGVSMVGDCREGVDNITGGRKIEGGRKLG